MAEEYERKKDEKKKTPSENLKALKRLRMHNYTTPMRQKN